jgi:hypothetical protein
MRTSRAILIGLLITGATAACATVETEKPQLIVTNHSRHLVQAIRLRQCADQSTDYTDVPNSTLRSGHSVVIEVHDPCIDVLAVDKSGHVLGKQDRLRIPPKATWLIR